MIASTGLSASIVSGTHRMSSAKSGIASSPSVATASTRASRARPSMTLLMSLSWSAERVAMATSGTSASSSEIGPCLSSPAA